MMKSVFGALAALLVVASLAPAHAQASAGLDGPHSHTGLGNPPVVLPVDGSGCLNLGVAVVCASSNGNPQTPSFGATCNPYVTCGLTGSSPGATSLGSSTTNCASFSVGIVQAGCTSPGSVNPPGIQTGGTAGGTSTGGPPGLLTKSCPGYAQMFPVAQACPTPLPASATGLGSFPSSNSSPANPAGTGAGANPPATGGGTNTSGAGSSNASAPTVDCYFGADPNPHSATAADCFTQGGSLVQQLGSAGSSGSPGAASAGSSGNVGGASTISCYLGSSASATAMTAADCFSSGGSLVPALDSGDSIQPPSSTGP
jgi:hypothetical protein